MPASVVGRDAELAAIDDFLLRISDGAAALVLEGEAGMGKTTLWRHALDRVERSTGVVLRAQPAESETALSFSALGDLLHPVLGAALEPLPEGQRAALSRALVLDDAPGAAPEPRALGVAVLNVLRHLASEQALVVGVDDVQWLDPASASALAYAVRRLESERVAVILSRRAGLESPLVEEVRRAPIGERATQLPVGPMSAEGLHLVVQTRLGIVLPRPLLGEVHQASGGNPLYALEIVRTLTRENVVVEAGRPLPVPESLHDAVHGRLLDLPPEARDFLVAAAAHAHPTVAVTEAASGVPAAAGLTPALDAQIVVLERERIRFTHPLLAAGAYEAADPLRRQEIHVRLAAILTDPEARAWQLAASAVEPDEAVAAELERAAQAARARGAPRPAALLLDRACELTPADRPDERHRRAIDAAYLHYESGDSPRAESQLEGVIGELAPGRMRARALVRLARVRSYENQREAANLFAQAIDEGHEDVETLATAHEGLAACLFRLREQLASAVEHAALAATLADRIGDDALVAEALGTQTIAEALLGRPEASETAARALALEDAARDRRVIGQPLFAVAVYRWWLSEVEQALEAGRRLVLRSRELGDESSLPYLFVVIGQASYFLGKLDEARQHAVDGQELARRSGQAMLVAYCCALEAQVEACRGHVDGARALAAQALDALDETAGRPAELVARAALGLLELALGAPQDAADALAPVVAHVRKENFGEPAAMWFVTDHVEALVELGRTDEALDLLSWFDAHAGRLERSTARANCLRCRGLLAARRGSVDASIPDFERALELHGHVEFPLDRGRTLLALGAAQRRLKRRREARVTLEAALGVFQELGAALWAERARGELKRISGRAATPGALTPAEERVATLVAAGKTNREVAAALFLSDRTVEGHLAHIFGKLGIRHRGELAAALQTRGSPPSNTGDGPVFPQESAP